MLNFTLSSVPKGNQNAPFISLASAVNSLIRSDSLASKEYKKLFVNISNVEQLISIRSKGHQNSD